jgi:hypothetical protein
MTDLSDALPILKPLLAGLVGGGFVWLITTYSKRSRPAEFDPENVTGRIAPSRILSFGLLLVFLGISSAAAYAAFRTPSADCACSGTASTVIPAVLGAICALLALFCAMGLTRKWDITWDEDGIEGPTSLWFPPFGPRREKWMWERLEGVGGTSGQWFVENAAGRRIRFNYSYPGYMQLMATIEDQCPWLFDRPSDSPEGASSAGDEADQPLRTN